MAKDRSVSDHRSRKAGAVRPPRPEGEALALACVGWAHDRKALDPIVLDLRGRSPFTDFFVVVSGRSDRQVKAIVESVVKGLKGARFSIICT
jgi:ribosome-associated protein